MQRRRFLGASVATIIGSPAIASEKLGEAETINRPVYADTKIALCIGISAYENHPALTTPRADADLLARDFIRLGIKTWVLMDPSYQELFLGISRFRILAKNADLAVVYIAGHGGFNGDEVLVYPTDMPKLLNTPDYALSEEILVKALAGQPRNKVLFLDCCRTTVSSRSEAKPLEHVGGLFSLYAAQPGAQAYDGMEANGPFASALSQALKKPDEPLESVARNTRVNVIKSTGGAQIPWSKSSLLNEVILNREKV